MRPRKKLIGQENTDASTKKKIAQENTHSFRKASTKKTTRSKKHPIVQESIHEKMNSFKKIKKNQVVLISQIDKSYRVVESKID